jgi:hypothetical protein
VISQSTIGWDCLDWNTRLNEGLHLRDTGKPLNRHNNLPFSGAAVRFDDMIHQSGGVLVLRDHARRFFYALFLIGTVAGSEV